MANNFKNTSLVTKIAVKEFLNSLVMGQKVDRQLDSQFQKVGASIVQPLAQQVTLKNVPLVSF